MKRNIPTVLMSYEEDLLVFMEMTMHCARTICQMNAEKMSPQTKDYTKGYRVNGVN